MLVAAWALLTGGWSAEVADAPSADSPSADTATLSTSQAQRAADLLAQMSDSPTATDTASISLAKQRTSVLQRLQAIRGLLELGKNADAAKVYLNLHRHLEALAEERREALRRDPAISRQLLAMTRALLGRVPATADSPTDGARVAEGADSPSLGSLPESADETGRSMDSDSDTASDTDTVGF